MPCARIRSLAVMTIVLPCLCSCAGPGRVFAKPRVHVLGADVANVTLASTDVVFAVAVENPNAISFVLDTVGYHLRVNGERLLDGETPLRAEIAARSASEVRLPVRLRYSDVLRVFQAVKGERHAGYDLEADFHFAVPVVGKFSVPVRKQGDFSLDDVRLLR